MMAGAAASESVLFIGSILAAAGLAAAMGSVASDYSQGLRERADALGAQMTSRLAIVNDPLNVPTDPLRLYVKNSGSSTFHPASFAVLVDGELAASWTLTVAGEPAVAVRPGQLATLSVTGLSLAAGDHTATVIAGSASATLDFRV